jgi:hypothetical protein
MFGCPNPTKTSFRFPEMLIGALFTVAVLAIGVTFPWSWQQSGEVTKAAMSAVEQREGIWNWLTHDAAGFFAVWLVIYGAIQLILFYVQLKLIGPSLVDAELPVDTAKLQAQIADASLKTSQDTANRQLRAYLGYEPQGAHFEQVYNGVSRAFEDTGPVKYFEKNYGQTPAINLTMHVRVIDGLNPPEDFERDVPRIEVMQTVFPGQRVRKIVDRSKKKRHKFFLYGYIDYEDVFGGKWRRRFAFTHDPERPGKGDDQWIAHHANNDEYQR